MAGKPPRLDGAPLLYASWFTKDIKALPSALGNQTTNPQPDMVTAHAELGERCFYCGKILPILYATWDHVLPILYATWDHVLPTSAGGKNEAANRVVCCNSCNKQKADLTISQWRQAAWGSNNGKFYGEWLAGVRMGSTGVSNKNGVLIVIDSDSGLLMVPSPAAIMEKRLRSINLAMRNALEGFAKEADANYIPGKMETFELRFPADMRQQVLVLDPFWEAKLLRHLDTCGWYCYWNDAIDKYILKSLEQAEKYWEPSQDTTEAPQSEEPTTDA